VEHRAGGDVGKGAGRRISRARSGTSSGPAQITGAEQDTLYKPAREQGIYTTARGCMLLELHVPLVAHKRDLSTGQAEAFNRPSPAE
jgi:hypothetical protein